MNTNTLQDIKQLYYGNHLEKNELLEVEKFLKRILLEVEKRKKSFDI